MMLCWLQDILVLGACYACTCQVLLQVLPLQVVTQVLHLCLFAFRWRCQGQACRSLPHPSRTPAGRAAPFSWWLASLLLTTSQTTCCPASRSTAGMPQQPLELDSTRPVGSCGCMIMCMPATVPPAAAAAACMVLTSSRVHRQVHRDPAVLSWPGSPGQASTDPSSQALLPGALVLPGALSSPAHLLRLPTSHRAEALLSICCPQAPDSASMLLLKPGAPHSSWQAAGAHAVLAGGYDLPMWEGGPQAMGGVARLPSFGITPAQLDALWDSQPSPVLRPGPDVRPAGSGLSEGRPDDWTRIPAHCRRPRLRRGISGAWLMDCVCCSEVEMGLPGMQIWSQGLHCWLCMTHTVQGGQCLLKALFQVSASLKPANVHLGCQHLTQAS